MTVAGKKAKAKKPARKAAGSRKSRAGRPPAVESHPKRDAILKAILTPGANFGQIQRNFGISRRALDTFRAKWVTDPTQKALDEIAQAKDAMPVAAIDVMAKLALLVDRGYRMLAAADEWLEDPNAPGKYNLNPRSHEVDVVYEEEIPVGDTFRTRRRTEKLSKLMSDVERGLGITIVKGETKTADPRKLLLEAVATLKPVLEVIGKNTGELKSDPKIEIHLHPEVVELRHVLTEWFVTRHPDEVDELAGILEGRVK